MRRILLTAAAAAAFSAGGGALAQDYTPYEIDCSSGNYGRAFCETPAGFHIGRAELVHQYSSAACEQGESWGYEANGVWVDDGCRARFALYGSGAAATAATLIACSSGDYSYAYCTADVDVRAVRLERQLSSAACEQGDSWGWDAAGVWVDDGCRAEFRINDPADLPDDGPRWGGYGDDAGSDRGYGENGYGESYGDGERGGFTPEYTSADALEACQRAMIERAWEDGDYAVQLSPGYTVDFARGWNVSGRATRLGPSGFADVDVSCRFGRGEVRELTVTPTGSD